MRSLTILQMLEKNRLDTGSVQQMLQAATGLAARGHRVTIVSRPGGDLEPRVREAGLGWAALPLRSELDLMSIARLRGLLRRLRPDVLHVHKGLAHTIALAASWFDRVPAFVVNRGVTFPLTVWNSPKYRSGRVSRIVAVSGAVRDVIVASGRVAASKVEVIPAGTDVERFDPARWSPDVFRHELGIAEDDELLLQVGVREWKGWRDLTDAVALLSQRRPRLRVALIGCRSEATASEILAWARERGIGDRLSIRGYRDDLPAIFAAADCVVDASWQGTGITGTIREAMAMARPVVATDCGGNRELVASPDVGWVVPARDAGSLAGAIDEVLSDPARAARTGANARARVVADFSLERRIDRLEGLYFSLIDRDGRPASSLHGERDRSRAASG